MTDYNEQKKGLVFDIYRGTTHDGPGMRTTFFLKGCPLSCKWCHNPESIAYENEISYTKKKCIGCTNCNRVSGKEIVIVNNGQINLKAKHKDIPEIAAVCCPAKALSMEAKEYTVDELVKEALKDKEYFKSFDGGVTISGGEPTARYRFVLEVLKKLKEHGINTALDTSGYAKWDVFVKLLPFVDVVLYDLKIFEPNLHMELTGVDNKLILENFKKVAYYKKSEKAGLEIWVRTPLIPKATATARNIKEIGGFIRHYGNKEISRWELCAFNNTCNGKYESLGKTWEYKDEQLLTESQADNLLKVAMDYFAKDRTILSGFTRKE